MTGAANLNTNQPPSGDAPTGQKARLLNRLLPTYPQPLPRPSSSRVDYDKVPLGEVALNAILSAIASMVMALSKSRYCPICRFRGAEIGRVCFRIQIAVLSTSAHVPAVSQLPVAHEIRTATIITRQIIVLSRACASIIRPLTKDELSRPSASASSTASCIAPTTVILTSSYLDLTRCRPRERARDRCARPSASTHPATARVALINQPSMRVGAHLEADGFRLGARQVDGRNHPRVIVRRHLGSHLTPQAAHPLDINCSRQSISSRRTSNPDYRADIAEPQSRQHSTVCLPCLP